MLYGEYDANGNMLREYVYLNGEPIAQVDAGETLIYLHTDHLGTPRVASNTSGASVWSWDSNAFGVGTPSGSAVVNLRFAGQYWDTESGLHYNWNRYYDPETGRYISSDPIGLQGGLNTFAYVGANPVMLADPEGLWFKGCKKYIDDPIMKPIEEGVKKATRQCMQNGKDIFDKLFPAKNLSDLFKNGRIPTASELIKFARDQGWKMIDNGSGPIKFVDKNGIVRLTIKRGSSRTAGSEDPHVEVRDATGNRVDPRTGQKVSRKSPENHTPVDYDL